ncbi:BolA/IbaG family iron-sulfur metabolism protein [Gammaproteobacteria bacterium]|nr:BolA/IbaG family iron-sulfur metabolism protein [Gammaproteobacteria bacterium]
MSIADTIKSKVMSRITPDYIELLNESHMHAGPATESHFKLVLVADEFKTLSPVKRHQMLYKLLQEELAGPVHALALHLYTQPEWETQKNAAPQSPNCKGG